MEGVKSTSSGTGARLHPSNADGREAIATWTLKRQRLFSLEIDYDAIASLLPDELEAIEVRPRVALLSVVAVVTEPGDLGPGSPGFNELAVVIGTHADLTVDTPRPRFSFYAVSILANSEAFVQLSRTQLHNPTRLSPGLTIEASDGGRIVTVQDADGPIAELIRPVKLPPARPFDVWGQLFNHDGGVTRLCPWHWTGQIHEYQGREAWGRLFAHPVFGGIDVSAIRRCFLQMSSVDDTRASERFYAAGELR